MEGIVGGILNFSRSSQRSWLSADQGGCGGDVGKSKLVHDGAVDALRVTIVKTQPFKAYSSFAPDPA